MTEETPDEPFVEEEEEAAAAEAARIGGPRPEYDADEAHRPAAESGEGEAEGFEQAEAELIERAENPHGPSPLADAEGIVEDPEALDVEYGEADHEYTAEDDPDDSDR